MRSLYFSLFISLIFISLCSASSPQEAHVFAGKDFEFDLSYESAEKSEGIKRYLNKDAGDVEKWQFFYFCEVKKNKDKCGAWVDEKGTKISGSTPKVKRTKTGATVMKMSEEDSGYYTRVPENKDETHAFLERVRVGVQSPPPPPPKIY